MFNSFFARVAFFQFIGIFIYIFGFLLWLYYFNLPDIDKRIFDSQQETLTRGLADISDNLGESTHLFPSFFKRIEKIIVDTSSVASSDKKLEYVQLIAVHDKDGNILYASEKHPFLDLLPLKMDAKIIVANEKEWHVFESRSQKKGYYLTLAESKQDRQALIGNPLSDVLQFSSVILLIMGITILFCAYYTLKPLRLAAQNIATRQLRDSDLLDPKQYYIEIQPIINEINKLIRRLQSASTREKRFLADAAHEIRTPTAAIQTQLYLLTQLQDPAEKEGVIIDMMSTVNRVSSLSSQLIHISRMESEEIKIKKEIINVNSCIRQCIDFYIHSAHERRIHIQFSPDYEVNICNDRQMFFTIISNILDNAIKYIHHDGNVEINLVSDTTDYCNISIRDDGPGIPVQYRPMIFDRFYRIPGVTKPGSGLGLAIVKNIVDKLGGKIDVKDGINGKGIGFTIELSILNKHQDA